MTDGALLLLIPILAAAFVASASPGPATLAIAREAMSRGRRAGVSLALGVTFGSWTWSAAAAGGLGAVMLAHGWALEVMRVLAALYLGWLAWKSARAALRPAAPLAPGRPASGRSFATGLMLHLTNPKAILFFGALYSVGLPPGTTPGTVLLVAALIGVQSLVVFVTLALVFSHGGLAAGYLRLRRLFEAAFATVFALAAFAFLAPILRSALEALRRSPA
jgi:threonine/homoserine/homoserine lactone efflux protein